MIEETESTIPLVDVPQINWRSLRSKKTKYVLELIDTYGPDILYTTDSTGLYPIHWAVVHDKPEIIGRMIKEGVSPQLTARIYDEPTPIHFAALEGRLDVIDLLLSHGIDIDVKDRGCTPLMRASIFGQNPKTKSSQTVLHLISRGADLNQTDENGLNCLHHAVRYSHEDTVHLLLNLGMDPNQRTISGKRALDFATLSGNEYLMRLLAPLTHQITRNDLKLLILKYKKKQMIEMLFRAIILLGPTVVLFGILSLILYGYPQYILYYLPNTSSDVAIHIILIIVNVFIWISLYLTCATQPGYLPFNTKEYFKELASKIEAGRRAKASVRPKIGKHSIENKDIRLCHTCRTVKTNRSSHCRYCKRCIASFDHHCIYLSSCIGQNNRLAFFSLGFNIFLSGLFSTYLVVNLALTQNSLFTPYHWFNALYCLNFTIIGSILTFCNLRRAAMNMTQNEELKYRRYYYRMDREGQFVNPFDRGSYLKNIIEYFTTKHYNYSKVNIFEC